MPDTKAQRSLPNRETHGDDGTGPATGEGKPASFPTSRRHETETAHHAQDEELPGKPAGGKEKPKG